MLTTTCFGQCGPSSGHKMYIEENYKECYHSIGAYSKLSTRSRCRLDYTAKSTFCNLKMAHSGRNMSSSA